MVALPFLLAPIGASATEFTAGTVLKEMPARERFAYIAGIVEGLAYVRYQQDGQKPKGMKCIYDWFYENDAIMGDIEQMFREFADYPPGAVIAVMTEDRCGT